jgi:hypothetical protein
MKGCSAPKCRAPEMGCDLGETDLQNCPNWRTAALSPPIGEVQEGAETINEVLPWSGNALGLQSLSFVAGRGRPEIVALVGPYNAGKTTLLGSWYLLTSHGHFPGSFRFAGSYTLEGWENVSHSLRWSGDAGPMFPAHTPVGGRYAGMLHLAFRSSTGHLRDFLFVDAPGEWYQRWSVNENAPDAEGARWIEENADLFLVLADSESLTGENRGEARSTLELLLDRIGSRLNRRPLALVWSKVDKSPSQEMRRAIHNAAVLASHDVAEFPISVYPENEEQLVTRRFLDVLDWIIEQKPKFVAVDYASNLRSTSLGPYGRAQFNDGKH